MWFYIWERWQLFLSRSGRTLRSWSWTAAEWSMISFRILKYGHTTEENTMPGVIGRSCPPIIVNLSCLLRFLQFPLRLWDCFCRMLWKQPAAICWHPGLGFLSPASCFWWWTSSRQVTKYRKMYPFGSRWLSAFFRESPYFRESPGPVWP